MRSWFRSRSEGRLDQELRFHFDEQVAEYVVAGMSPEEARRRARLEFGHLDEVKEECRDVRPLAWLDGLRRDVRFALRLFARSPGFTAVCLITLALGIGANGAVFSLINELVLKPPPYTNPEELFVVSEDRSWAAGFSPYLHSYLFRGELRSIRDIAIMDSGISVLRGTEEAEVVGLGMASSNFLGLLGVAPQIGRWFTEEEEHERAPVVVLSHELWNRRFSADAHVLGKSVVVGDDEPTSYRIIGVLPEILEREFPFNQYEDIALLVPHDSTRFEQRNYAQGTTIARLAPGATPEQAHAELIDKQAAIAPARTTGYRDGGQSSSGRRAIFVEELASYDIKHVATGLWIAVSAVGCILLIACANITGLMLTRSAERGHELSIRRGLGAGRREIFSQTLIEASLLAVGGGALALVASWLCIRALKALSFSTLKGIQNASMDWTVAAYCFALAAGVAALVGALPAWFASRAEALGTLRQTASTARLGNKRGRDMLVIGQIALSVVLVVGAALLVHSMSLLVSVEKGYDATDVVSFDLAVGRPSEGAAESVRQLLARVQAVPNVRSAALTNFDPTSRNRLMAGYELEGEPGSLRNVEGRPVSSDYFATLSIPFLEGQTFARELTDDGVQVVVNRAFADLHWPGQRAVGQRITLYAKSVEIIGVVENPRFGSYRDEPRPTIFTQSLPAPSTLLVKTDGATEGTIQALREALREVSPVLAVRSIETLDEKLARHNAELRFYMYLLSALSALALLLAVVGLYSVAAQAAVRRTQEIGLRMAIGASRVQILAMIARQGLVLAGAGIAVGIAASYALSKYLESWLYEITPTDPLTFGAAALLLAAVAWLATFLPARRAARLDPMKALRYE